jgi:hypothetical protein
VNLTLAHDAIDKKNLDRRVLRDLLGHLLVSLMVMNKVLIALGLCVLPDGLFDELDIVGAGVEVLDGEVVADPR